MTITRATARRTLLFYLLMGIPGVFSLEFLPGRFIVSGDPAATTLRIANGAQLYRLITFGDLVSSVGFVLLAWSLYQLFEDVDRRQAQLLVLFVIVSSVLGLLDVVLLSAPLVMQGNGSVATAFTATQLSLVTTGAFRMRNALLQVDELFWGLWLLPFGVLVIKSGAIPKLIGVLLILGCAAWVILSLRAIVFPQARMIDRWIFPLTAPGELTMVLWLVYRSFRLAPRETSLAYAN